MRKVRYAKGAQTKEQTKIVVRCNRSKLALNFILCKRQRDQLCVRPRTRRAACEERDFLVAGRNARRNVVNNLVRVKSRSRDALRCPSHGNQFFSGRGERVALFPVAGRNFSEFERWLPGFPGTNAEIQIRHAARGVVVDERTPLSRRNTLWEFQLENTRRIVRRSVSSCDTRASPSARSCSDAWELQDLPREDDHGLFVKRVTLKARKTTRSFPRREFYYRVGLSLAVSCANDLSAVIPRPFPPLHVSPERSTPERSVNQSIGRSRVSRDGDARR